MILKIVSMSSFCLFIAHAAWAMDTSPYKPGQKLTEEQAEELQNRFSSRETQDWKAASSQSSIDGRPDADLVHYGIQVLDKTVTSIGPKGGPQMTQYCVAALVKGAAINCGLRLVLSHLHAMETMDWACERRITPRPESINSHLWWARTHLMMEPV